MTGAPSPPEPDRRGARGGEEPIERTDHPGAEADADVDADVAGGSAGAGAGSSAQAFPTAAGSSAAGAAGQGRRGVAAAMDPQSDRWLVDKARGGDPDAWEVLIRRHRLRIYRIALRMLGDPDDAEDLTQDVVVQVFTAIAGFTGASSFSTWLYRIVINRSLNHRRRQRPTRPILESDHPTIAGPEQAVEARGRVEATAHALAGLPRSLRSAFVLHEMEGLSYQEVATILNVSEPTVRGRIYRARRHLLDELGEWS